MRWMRNVGHTESYIQGSQVMFEDSIHMKFELGGFSDEKS